MPGVKKAAEALEAPAVACTNCAQPAVYTLGDSVNPIQYCAKCLPRHFVADASAGLFPLVVPA